MNILAILGVRTQCGIFVIFYINQILREIILGDSGSSKSAIFTYLEALNFDSYDIFSLLKAEIYQMTESKYSEFLKNSKVDDLVAAAIFQRNRVYFTKMLQFTLNHNKVQSLFYNLEIPNQ